ncbi:MAG TPA: apolipoprotein N-acyltransferase, partial [Geobacteraceae bacterium]|nr:apolipoprotein N-acyltransferase [Geobacteraceae bacterium]
CWPAARGGGFECGRWAGDKHIEPELFLREHQEMSRTLAAANALDLIVWPESVYIADHASREGQLPPHVLDGLHTPTLFGAILRFDRGGDPRIYNSAVLANGTGQILGSYDKMVLVPFGEFIPFGDTFPWLYSWSPHSGRFWPGENKEPLLLGRHLFSVSICYEDIFPGHIRMLMHGGRDHHVPEAMFNLTNDSWYGNTVEPMEHLALASFRAIEHRRPLVRATNTGVSAIVDPVGRLDHRSKQWTKETLVGQIPMMQIRTIYALLGDWLGWLCAILALLGIVRSYQLTGQHVEHKKTNDSKVKKRHQLLPVARKRPRK